MSAVAVAPTGWFGDPLNRYEGRFFDGDQWTNQVSDNGVLRLDPSWPTTPSPAISTESAISAEPAKKLPAVERRGSYDRRQITMKVDVERRKSDRRTG